MSKKSIQIFSLIISILALIYLVLSHYGILRYLNLHIYSTEDYINSYTKLPKASKDRVTICFTANSNELTKLKPFINSILDQTVKVDDIALTIPYTDIKDIPEDIKKVLSVYNYSKDYDNAGNLISSVMREPEANTKIIIVEPNMVYGQDFIETMIDASEKEPNKVIYGNNNKDKKFGILIMPKFFDEKISQYEKGKGYNLWLQQCCKADQEYINYSPIYKTWN